MAYYSRQAPRAYADNSGSEIAAMIGSAASDVAHGVEDYDTKQRKAQAAKEYQDRLLAEMAKEAMLKRDQEEWKQQFDETRETNDQRKIQDEMRRKAEEDRIAREGRIKSEEALRLFNAGKIDPQYETSGADYMFSDLDPNIPSRTGENLPQPQIQSTMTDHGVIFPEDSFERSLAVGSNVGLDAEQQRAFNLATQKPRDFAAEEEAKQRGRIELKNIWADVQKYAVDHKKFPPRSGRANAEDPIENETDALDQLLLIDRLKKTEQENSAGPGMPASPSAAKAAKWVNLDSQYFDWSRKNPELAEKAEAEYRKLKGK